MAQQTFRSAFNGFNREDVVHYLEYLNQQHTAEVNRLRSELEFLRSSKPQEAPVAAEPACCEQNDLIAQQAARIRELFDQCKAQEETIAQLNARVGELSTATAVPGTGEELEAYRRAERAERVAKERAEEIYRQTNAVLSEASVKVDEAVALISSMAGQLSGQLAQFQCAVTGSKQALQDAAATMYAIRPNAENE